MFLNPGQLFVVPCLCLPQTGIPHARCTDELGAMARKFCVLLIGIVRTPERPFLDQTSLQHELMLQALCDFFFRHAFCTPGPRRSLRNFRAASNRSFVDLMCTFPAPFCCWPSRHLLSFLSCICQVACTETQIKGDTTSECLSMQRQGTGSKSP